MRLDIVTPEKQLLSEEVKSVQLPGMDGDMTIMGTHAPMVTTLRPGVVIVESDGGKQEIVVTGGFAEISSEGTSILAELAVPKADLTGELVERAVKEAEEALELASTDPDKAAAALKINDMNELLARHSA